MATPAKPAQFEYKLAAVLPVESPPVVRLTQMFNRLREQTQGRFVTKVFPNSVLGTEQSLTGQLRVGAIQFYLIDGAISNFAPLGNLGGIPFAFETPARAFAAFDGDLGDYIRKDMESKGIFAFPTLWDYGFRNITTSTRPIKTPEDLAGLKLRTNLAKINEDFYKAFGASPTPVAVAETYTALQTKLVNGLDTPLPLIEDGHYYEVQRYLSLTRHAWTSLWVLANIDAWNALPPDIRELVQRNVRTFGLAERNDMIAFNRSLADKLQRQGLTLNSVDTAPFRKRLAPQYRSWKADFGPQAWDLLEKYAGKLA